MVPHGGLLQRDLLLRTTGVFHRKLVRTIIDGGGSDYLIVESLVKKKVEDQDRETRFHK